MGQLEEVTTLVFLYSNIADSWMVLLLSIGFNSVHALHCIQCDLQFASILCNVLLCVCP
jgi:hypothetical protein